MVEQVLHLLVGGGHGVDVELVAAGHPVDLGDGGAGLQPGHGLPKAPGGELQLKVAGHRPADFLGVDDGGVLLDDAPLLQGLDAAFHRHPGKAHLLPNVRVGEPGVLDEQGNNLLVQGVQTF